jgi:hypothetical protein
MREEDAKTKHTTTGSDAGQLESVQNRVASVQYNSQLDRFGQVGITPADHSWRDSDREYYPIREDDLGKILERLDKLEKDFIEYVDAHQVRLGARLSESQNKKSEFLQESASLRSDIYELMSKENCNNCNQ